MMGNIAPLPDRHDPAGMWYNAFRGEWDGIDRSVV